MSDDALRAEIKSESERRLHAWGVEVPTHLPLIEAVSEVRPRSARDVAVRASALGYVVAYGLDAPRDWVHERLDRFALWPAVSGDETRVLRASTISAQERIDLTWLTEATQELAWSLGVAEVDHSRRCDPDLAQRLSFGSDPAEFIAKAKLRPIREIQAESDLLYRLHWFTRECRLRNRESAFAEGLVRERRRAIDWVYGVAEDWDEVPADT
jgi:hypothetical protein